MDPNPFVDCEFMDSLPASAAGWRGKHGAIAVGRPHRDLGNTERRALRLHAAAIALVSAQLPSG
jgi:hypothetical protein